MVSTLCLSSGFLEASVCMIITSRLKRSLKLEVTCGLPVGGQSVQCCHGTWSARRCGWRNLALAQHQVRDCGIGEAVTRGINHRYQRACTVKAV